MENLPTTITNLAALYPFTLSYLRRDYLTAGLILNAGACSFLMHLVENHKHGMTGLIEVSTEDSRWYNKLDLVGVFLLVARLVMIADYGKILNSKSLFLLNVSVVGLNLISEFDKTPEGRNFYIITHSLWHLGAFFGTAFFYQNFV